VHLIDNALGNEELDGLINGLGFLLFTKLHRHIDLEQIARIPNFAGAKHVESGGEDHPGNGDDGALFTTALGDALVLEAIVRGILCDHGGMSDLDKSRLKVDTSSGDANGLLFTSGLVVAGGKASPGAEAFGGTKLCHIGADFGEDSNRGRAIYAGDEAQEVDVAFEGCDHFIDLVIESGEELVYKIKMLANESNALLLLIGHLEALNGIDNLIGLLFERALKQRGAMLKVESVGISVYDVVRDGGGRFAKHVGDDSIKGDIANGEGVLEAILFRGLATDQLVAIARVFSENTDGLVRDEGTGNQPKPEEIAYPLGILDVILVALDSGNPLGVGDGNTDIALQQVVDRDVVFPGRFHTDVIAMVVDQPLLEFSDGVVEGGEASLLVCRGRFLCRGDDCSDEKGLVYIDATTNRIMDVHVFSSSHCFDGGKAGTESPHNRQRANND